MLWQFLRPDAAVAFDDPGVRKVLGRYIDVAEGRSRARWLLARTVEIDPEAASAKEHARGLKELDHVVAEDIVLPTASFSLLDLKARMAAEHYASCALCERRCSVDRNVDRGVCGAGTTPFISSAFVHMGEEPELVPSGTVFFSGCNLRCVFCQNHDISRNPSAGEPADTQRLREAFTALVDRNVRNLNVVGGDPIPQLPAILKALTGMDENVPLVWNSNMFLTTEAMNILDGLVDVWLTDLKYGNDDCGSRLSGIERYFTVVTRNHRLASRHGELIIRHLVLPGHLECCTRPAMTWIADELGPDTRVNVMDQYHPDNLVSKNPERYSGLQRRLTKKEFDQAVALAREAGLTNILV
ncbi:MAG: radical SAM protein [Candidatus Undinarchaeales archaeon]|jgi:putative pyruvate formate lyase activating enzyme|nr:radical SAM protein [Candidatus Undinarchaeales archaeon]MDP7492354.1 radical SAM protein [Candidatus Undinarchaeales archaeon]